MKTIIDIPKPCHRDWSKMTIVEKGRFCKSCNKTVFDFTNQTREEIVRELNDKKDICGRLSTSQLTENKLLKRKDNFYLAKWTMLLGLGSILGITEPITAQNTKPKIELREKSEWKSILPNEIEKDSSIVLKGKVLGSYSDIPLVGVNVVLKGTTTGTQTDFDGEFSIEIPIKKLDNENYLVFTYVGFQTKELRFYKENKYFEIILNNTMPNDMPPEMFGIMVERKATPKPNIFDKIGCFLHNLFSKKPATNNAYAPDGNPSSVDK